MEYLLFETLKLLGGKKDTDNSINFIKPKLLIRHKDAGIKYTVSRIKIDDVTKKPKVICYRYMKPNKNNKKKIYISIEEQDFNKYEPV